MLLAGYQYPWQSCPVVPRSSPAVMLTSPQQPSNPLPHSIDAILHAKTPSSSPSSRGSSQSPKAALPHIETLRRHPRATGTPASPQALSSASVDDDSASPASEVGCEDGEDSRSDPPSSHSSSDSSEEQEHTVLVVDDGQECQEEHQTPKRQRTHVCLTSPDSTQQVLPPPKSQLMSALKSSTTLNAAIAGEGREKVKSAFRPIVRPWLIENESRARHVANSSSGAVNINNSLNRGGHRVGAGNKGGNCGTQRPLDAISMLRKQSSAFRVALGCSGNNRRPDMSKYHVTMAAMTSTPAMPERSGVGVGVGVGVVGTQPLPPSLASWFSWLRSGGLPLVGGHHPSPQPFHPCRSLLPPSAPNTSSVPAPPPPPPPPPPQAPRYNCEACGKSYSTFGGLSKHKQFHCAAQVKKDFRCKFCDKSYSSLGALKMHIRTHTLPCKCGVCGKAFSRPWLLQGHLRTHTGEKPFSCPHCARAFADRSNLRAHLQTHSDVKKYCCRHCSKTFSRMSLLVKHTESSCLALHS